MRRELVSTSFSAQRRACCAPGAVESRQVTGCMFAMAHPLDRRLSLRTTGREGSPTRGLWRRSIIPRGKGVVAQ